MTYPTKGRADHLDLGDWNAVCAKCGNKRKASSLVKDWKGLWVCPEHFEPRHPQEFVRAGKGEQPPPWTQPRPEYLLAAVCTPAGQTAIADYAVADCAIADFVFPGFNPTTGNVE